jgi:uncharacterized protein (TIGR00369 family)
MQDQKVPQARRSGYRRLIGYRTKVWREAYGEVEMTIGPEHLNSLGVVHGGVYASLLDASLGHAVSFCTTPGHARYSTTVSLTTTFVAAVSSGTLTAIGRIDGLHGRLVTASGEVRDQDGRLIALGQGSFLYFPGSERPEGVPKRVLAETPPSS